MKKLISLALALIMMFALAACGGGSESAEPGAIDFSEVPEVPEGKVLPDDATVKVVVASHASWPYDPDWAVWKYIKEGVGGTVDVTGIPSADFGTKFPLYMVDTESMPDVFGFMNKPGSFASYCGQGAFVSFDDCKDFMPDYHGFWENLSEDEQWMRDIRKAADGEVYYTPIYGTERSTNIRAWLYRKDIFEKNGLKTPETLDDLYKVSKKLKTIYPDSYPLCIRSGINNINVFGCSWKPNFHYNVYYDFEADKWTYGAREDVMYDLVSFFSKMVQEELVPPNFTTIEVAKWEELISTNRGFIMPEYQVRMDYFNIPARKTNPEFTFAVMTPPYDDKGQGIPKLNKYNCDPRGMSICNTGDATRIANAARYVNWFYTDEAAELVSWGKEGETYTKDAEGKRSYILTGDENAQLKYGLQTIGAYCRVAPDSIDACISEEQAAVTDLLLAEHTYEHLDPSHYLEFTEEDSKKKAELTTAIDTVVKENISKFITGQRPMSEWEDFQKELESLPIDELIAIHEKYEIVK